MLFGNTDRLKELLGPLFALVMTVWWIFWVAIYIGMLIISWDMGIGGFISTLIFGPIILGILQSIIFYPIAMIAALILDKN